jgi:hypothetical protein
LEEVLDLSEYFDLISYYFLFKLNIYVGLKKSFGCWCSKLENNEGFCEKVEGFAENWSGKSLKFNESLDC